MTALAAGLALLPLALAIRHPGSEIQTPMASVILSGLLTSTALNLSVAPALYPRFGQIGGRSQNELAQMAAEGPLGLLNPETPTMLAIIAG
jgi:Cu/Ag efflux pump CusA